MTDRLEDMKIDVKIKLSALWVALMFCYLYADVLTFFQSEALEDILAGEIADITITSEFLLGSAILMSIPIVMVFLSLTLKAKMNRKVNIILGTLHIVLLAITSLMPPVVLHYVYFGIVEAVFLVLIVWYAWKWPTQEG